MNTVKIVLKVERTLCSNLLGLQRTAIASVKIPDGIEWEEIAVRQHPSLAISEKVDDKVPLYTATLKFLTCQDINDRRYYAYRVTLVGGRQRLIGSAGRPYPVLTVAEQMPEKPSDNSWNEATITWTTPQIVPYIAG